MPDPGAGLLELPDNAIHLWVGPPKLENAALLVTDAEAVLSPEEQQRWNRLLRPADQERFAYAHVALRRVLSQYAPTEPAAWMFHADQHGRPEIIHATAAQDLRFNLSHADGMVAVVVHRGFDAGVDVERVGRVSDIDSVARTSYSPDERSLLQDASNAEQPELFTKIWTLKEAFLKATGIGGHVSLADFTFDPTPPDGITFSCTPQSGVDASAWTLALSHEADEHILAVACRPDDRLNPPTITRFDLSGLDVS